MSTLIVLFNLKPGVSVEDYERWARATDLPVAGALASVDSFEVYKSMSLLGAVGRAPYQYIERLVINDMDQLGKDVGSAAMQAVSAQFQAFADQPLFIVCEQL